MADYSQQVSQLQDLINQNPQVQAAKAKFAQTHSPVDWIPIEEATQQAFQQAGVPIDQIESLRVSVDGQGNVQINPDSEWSPQRIAMMVGIAAATWGVGSALSGVAPALGGGTTGSLASLGLKTAAGYGLNKLSQAATSADSNPVGSTLSGIGTALGGISTNEAQAREAQDNFNLTAEQQYQNELIAMANLEGNQRNRELLNMQDASIVNNPRVSPFDVTGGPKYDPAFVKTLNSLEGQGATALSKPPTYDATTLPKPTLQTPSQPSALASISDTLSPILKGAGQIPWSRIFGTGTGGPQMPRTPWTALPNPVNNIPPPDNNFNPGADTSTPIDTGEDF